MCKPTLVSRKKIETTPNAYYDDDCLDVFISPERKPAHNNNKISVANLNVRGSVNLCEPSSFQLIDVNRESETNSSDLFLFDMDVRHILLQNTQTSKDAQPEA